MGIQKFFYTNHRRAHNNPRDIFNTAFNAPQTLHQHTVIYMKRLRIERWARQNSSPRIRQAYLRLPNQDFRIQHQSTATAALRDNDIKPKVAPITPDHLSSLPSPPPSAALQSAPLAALHARLNLPTKLPLQTLARTLVHKSADPSPAFNNTSLAQLGNHLLGYWTAEYIICRWPRLPMSVLFDAAWAYAGPKSLSLVAQEWGVEAAAEPGGEVEPALLQFKRLPPRMAWNGEKGEATTKPRLQMKWRKSISAATVYNNEFGEEFASRWEAQSQDNLPRDDGIPLDQAQTAFARAVFGAIYLHAGRSASRDFFKSHILSRDLKISDMFEFAQPTRDLSRLCAREGFESPIARIMSETGRRSLTPVFVVAVYSGQDKLGEAAGSSLDEARTRAAIAALKSWYLYQPVEYRVPSDMEEPNAQDRPWTPAHIDCGEVVV
ncbi:MAG: hypothetical protein M1824_003350 [Vezdaea acicularis]|nr:MAG: hypothetical protein M1824_003350 [Vezdaea acicularis]